MKKILLSLALTLGFLNVRCQQSPVNDTLIPKQHRDDTILYEPKLQGGALIDTINTRNKTDYRPGFIEDSTKQKNSGKKPKGNHY